MTPLTRTSSFLSPWRDLDSMERRMRRMLRSPAGDGEETVGWSPAVEVTETDDELTLTAEIPGVEPENVDVEIEGRTLSIHGEKKVSREEEKTAGERQYRLWEREYGEFSRTFSLPRSVDPDRIEAEFRNGVLTVHMPRTAEARGRKIQIETS